MKYDFSQKEKNQSTQNPRTFFSRTKKMLHSLPTSIEGVPLGFYEKQLNEQSGLIPYIGNRLKRRFCNKVKASPKELEEEQKELQIAVISQVAENLWLNFCAKGKDSPMLRHLQDTLREQYGEALVFKYKQHSNEVFIMLKVKDCFWSLTRTAQLNLLNRARQISQEVVSSYVC